MQKYTIPINTRVNGVIKIIPIFDLHVLNSAFDENLFKEYVDYIASTGIIRIGFVVVM